MSNWLMIALVVMGAMMLPSRGEDAAVTAPPDGWRLVAARDEIAPRAEVVRDASGSGYGLALAGTGDRSVDGRWVRRVPVTGGRYVMFEARFRATNVETPTRSVVPSVLWFDGRGKQVEQAEFPITVPGADGQGWHRVTATYRVPASAREAQLELRLRWAPSGEVVWRDVSLQETAAPAPRNVKIASVNHRPRGTKTSQQNLEQFAKFIDEAGAAKADVICLPEGITVCGTKLKYADVAEPIPGPSTQFLGECAARNHAYVVAGIYEREGRAVYNTSVLLGRDGKLMGKYRKVCLPREEIDGGITPGVEYPVLTRTSAGSA
jgi:hypothetical protein